MKPGKGGDSGTRGFLLDLNRCTGCHACELACSTENELGWGRSWRRVLTFNEPRRPEYAAFHLSLACNHCAEAPCREQCPALAIRRDEATGTVQIDAERCIGCRYCSWVCPYDAPRFDAAAGVMGKCTLCSHRLEESRSPACVEGCPTSALRYGPLEGEPLVPGFPDTPARPAIRFTPLLRGSSPPESSWTVPSDVTASFAEARQPAAEGISLRSEWPLLVFTLVLSLLAGWVLAAAVQGAAPPAVPFAALAAGAAAASTLHLGRKARAWRAILNVGRSWLSREVAAFTAFVAVSLGWCVAAAAEATETAWPGYVAAALGLLALFCADRVYDPVRTWLPIHSADTILTGLLAAAVLGGWAAAAVTMIAVKLFLYGLRPGRLARNVLVTITRVGAGMIAPAVLLISWPGIGLALPFVLLGAGELIDRGLFYAELEIRTPARLLEEISPGAVAAPAVAPAPRQGSSA